MSRAILILAAFALSLATAGCPHGHDQDGKSHGHEHNSDGSHKTGKTAPKAPAPKIATSVKDPICGMAVTTDSAHAVERDGKHHYFCSAACQTKFKAAPAPKAAKKTEADGDHGHDHGDNDHDH